MYLCVYLCQQFHPDEEGAISASEDGTSRVWDLSTGKCVKILADGRKEHEALRACWAPRGSSHGRSIAAATGSADGIVRLWGMAAGATVTGVERYRALKVVGRLNHCNEAERLDGQVYSCMFLAEHSADGAAAGIGARRLLTASDQSVHLWDIKTCKRVVSRALSKVGEISIGGERNPNDLSFVFDVKPRPGSGSNVLAVALSDGTVRVGDILHGEHPTSVLRAQSTIQTSLAWSADASTLVSCGRDGSLTIFDARTWTIRSTLSGHSGPVYGAEFYSWESGGSSTQLMLSWSSDETICIWDLSRATDNATTLPVAILSVQRGFPIYSCSVSPDGRRLAVAGGGDGKPGFLGVPIKIVDLHMDKQPTKGGGEDHGARQACSLSSDIDVVA